MGTPPQTPLQVVIAYIFVIKATVFVMISIYSAGSKVINSDYNDIFMGWASSTSMVGTLLGGLMPGFSLFFSIDYVHDSWHLWSLQLPLVAAFGIFCYLFMAGYMDPESDEIMEMQMELSRTRELNPPITRNRDAANRISFTLD
eukprot:TRINITY_DN3625_c0_g1_i1.p1 TRINITY_DN3625_c0_g1~~TRINITY_DN3625_c0_g1_i1.p1  ORF type:complete len:144 (+),score=15.24 TRINITY_DN3625_c0_g1_i1:423-854(+)